MDSRWRPGTPERSPSAAKPPPVSGSTSQTRSVASGSVHRLLARTVHEHLTARRVGARRRGRGSAPAASPTRLNRRPVGGAQDEGVPLRQSAPPPPPPPAPIARAALVIDPTRAVLVGALAAPHLREARIDEARGDVHVEEEALKARVLMEEDDPRFLEDLAIFLSDRPQGGNVVGLGA